MSQPAVAPRMTAEAFLAWERSQHTRHHFVRGDIFAMAGGSPRHSRLAARLIARLDAVLAGKRCDVHTADLRLGLDAEHFVYADAVVVCRPLVLRPGTTDVVTNPSLVCEVLSKSTEAYDRGSKQAGYLALPSLSHFVLVSQSESRVEVYGREGDGFRFRVHGPGELVRLEHFGATMALDELYEGAFELPGDDA